MKYRTLGKTNLKVSEVGMGTWQLAGKPGTWAWAKSDYQESLRSLYKFTELGGNFIDTAWVYGYSDNNPSSHPSEEMIGKFLKESKSRQKTVIASKIPPKNFQWPTHYGNKIEDVFPKQHIEKCVDDSLKNLSIDFIDLMQFHVWQDDWVNNEEWKETIMKITKAGKVKFWGISINDYQPSNCLKTLDTGLISTIQCIFNLFHQKPTEKLFPYAQKNNIGIIARVPLDEGGLTGKFNKDTKFITGDFRNDYYTPVRLQELEKRVNELKKIMAGETSSILDLNIRYILSQNAVSTVIPGIRKVDHAISLVQVSDGKKLSEGFLTELKKHSWERNFYPESWCDPALKKTGYIEI